MRILKLSAVLFALLATPVAAAPGDMAIATFLSRADALQARGALALLSPDVRVLRSEGEAAGAAYRAQLAQERTAGHPSSCPPPRSRMTSDQFLTYLRTYPVGVRSSTTVRMAVRDYFIRTYPCH
jgi:hypothetical protein